MLRRLGVAQLMVRTALAYRRTGGNCPWARPKQAHGPWESGRFICGLWG